MKGRYWELPQGSWEEAPRAEPLEMARGELREETGLEAARMIYAGHLFEACGYSNQGFHIFFATGLRRGNADLEAGGARPRDAGFRTVGSRADDPRQRN